MGEVRSVIDCGEDGGVSSLISTIVKCTGGVVGGVASSSNFISTRLASKCGEGRRVLEKWTLFLVEDVRLGCSISLMAAADCCIWRGF